MPVRLSLLARVRCRARIIWHRLHGAAPPHPLPAGARQILSLAQQEAQRLGHPCLGTEHLLLAVLRAPPGTAGRLLTQAGLTLSQARQAIAALAGTEVARRPGALGLTPQVKQVLVLAWGEAARRRQAVITPEHVLLGLLRADGGLAAGVLTHLHIAPAQLRRQVATALAEA